MRRSLLAGRVVGGFVPTTVPDEERGKVYRHAKRDRFTLGTVYLQNEADNNDSDETVVRDEIEGVYSIISNDSNDNNKAGAADVVAIVIDESSLASVVRR